MSDKALPSSERAKLIRLLSEQLSNGYETDASVATNDEKLQVEVEKYRLAKKWIDEHRAEYLGQWVALDGDRLIGHGFNARELHLKAKSEGIEIPFVEQVTEEPKFFYAGWE
ncbi:MAG: DUF5678 domain-containing protein [Blastocatellales bacterium]